MATSLQDIFEAWTDYVSKTIVVTVTSTGVPSGQTQFNPGEKVKYHLRAGTANVFNFIVPDPSTTGVSSFDTETSTTALTKNTEKTTMFIETTSLTTLTAGEKVTITGLEVIGKNAGTSVLEAHVHATLALDQLFPPGTTGKDGTKSLTVTT
jgi:hypothetical protein